MDDASVYIVGFDVDGGCMSQAKVVHVVVAVHAAVVSVRRSTAYNIYKHAVRESLS